MGVGLSHSHARYGQGYVIHFPSAHLYERHKDYWWIQRDTYLVRI
jgi:hypothetical protein